MNILVQNVSKINFGVYNELYFRNTLDNVSKRHYYKIINCSDWTRLEVEMIAKKTERNEN